MPKTWTQIYIPTHGPPSIMDRLPDEAIPRFWASAQKYPNFMLVLDEPDLKIFSVTNLLTAWILVRDA